MALQQLGSVHQAVDWLVLRGASALATDSRPSRVRLRRRRRRRRRRPALRDRLLEHETAHLALEPANVVLFTAARARARKV
jgi:hypothetical protein